ncbi:MAG: GIY-YIG nuclease family protein [Chloroflexi bacterium]|nr:GIY-YIG nuclease family protein [Chloroflexota bacterium]
MSTEGYIYILINPSFQKDMLKIGMTRRNPEERAAELSNTTGVPTSYVVAYEEQVPNIEFAEGLVHQRLDKYRTNKRREFFSMPLKIAINVVSQIAEEVRIIHKKEAATETDPNAGQFIQTLHR